MAQYDHLPPGVLPFMVSREAAAALVGVSTSKFDEMVGDGRMPEPRKADARVLWDTDELRAACRLLPRRSGKAHDGGNSWDRVLA
ncbi:helix-turn-helix transcriptional regulator [Humitalea sp. 24SJ18S-53]|uniref:helix-turn-helix transcriptional regulator n=1 Tax=Humitalea sp. 24SJ18S-53 TaxID=3422307 RepID=UPI003D66F605